MDVKLSIGEADVGTGNQIKEEVKKDEMDSLEEEEIWRTRQERIKNALAAARAAARQEPADLYAAASRLVDVIKRADVEEFISEIERLADQTDPSATIIFQGLPRGSLLHIAVLAGKDDILKLLLDNVHDLFIATQDNWGNTPLHLATKAKAIGVIDMLIRRAKDLPNVEDKLLLRMKNNHGNTALHEAVLTRDVDLVSHLLGEDLEPVYWENVDQKSPLYLALDTGNSKILEVLLSKSLDPSKIRGLPPIHGAVAREQYDLLGKILKNNMKLFAMRDSGGGNVFHLAAFGNVPEVFELLQLETEHLTQEQDNNGDLPIHIASKMGHVKLIDKLHPLSQWVNGKGQTVLHVAAKYGREEVVRSILKHPDLREMINERDHDGNTPSHLAVKNLQPAALVHLVLDERMNLLLLNHEGLAVVDSVPDPSPVGIRHTLVYILLKTVSAKRPDQFILKAENREKMHTGRSLIKSPQLEKLITTLLVVATLVTTVTFAAGFAVPGGFNSTDTASKDDHGMATMLDKRMFHAFTICNTIAMFCSMIAVVTLLWAQQSDIHTAIVAYRHSMLPLKIALPAMSAAFLTGITLTVGKLPWLANTIFYFGLVCLLIISVAKLLEDPPLIWSRHRPISIMVSWLVRAYIYLWEVETDVLGDPEEDRMVFWTSARGLLDDDSK